MVLCRSCKFFIPGTIGPGWCDQKNKIMHPKDEACIQKVRKYKRHTPKLKPTTLDQVL